MAYSITISIKKENLLERVSVDFLLLMGLLSNWLDIGVLWNCTFLLLFLINLAKTDNRNALSNYFLMSPFFYLLVFTGIMSIIFGNNQPYLGENIKIWTYAIMIPCMLVMLNKYDFDLKMFIESRWFLLNFFWIINLIVVSIQCSGIPLFIKQKWLDSNPFYPDNCAGLFGGSGTHCLTFFSIFMMIFNLRKAENILNKIKKVVVYNYVFFTSLWILFISPLNDNKALFVIMPAFLAIYLLVNTMSSRQIFAKRVKQILRYIIIIMLIITIVITFCALNRNIYNYICGHIIPSVSQMFALDKSFGVVSVERIGAALDALKNGYGFLLGDGLGSAGLLEHSRYYRGYLHFGMSSCSTMIILGGIWFYLSACLLLLRALVKLYNRKKCSALIKLVYFVVILVVSIYTNLFEVKVSLLWFCLIFVELGPDKINTLISAN